MQLLQARGQPIASLPYGTIAEAFVSADYRGRKGIWFAFARGGIGPTYMFPVLEDGKVSRFDGTVCSPMTLMKVYDPEALGIKTLEWTDAKMN